MDSDVKLRRRFLPVCVLVLALGCLARAGEIQFPSEPPQFTAGGEIHTDVAPRLEPGGESRTGAAGETVATPLGGMLWSLLRGSLLW